MKNDIIVILQSDKPIVTNLNNQESGIEISFIEEGETLDEIIDIFNRDRQRQSQRYNPDIIIFHRKKKEIIEEEEEEEEPEEV